MKNSYITVTDQFCGAGGSGQGARAAGVEVKQALNHWKLATETYETNFPEADVDCTDISACDPRRYLSTNILITSPECTTHSPAGGNHHKALKHQMSLFEKGIIDPATERSRATMWDVCRFAEYHDYEAIIVENVVEAKLRWALFDVWLKAMHVLGYQHRCCYLNSAHFHPTPQSRDRMYVVFWKKGNKAPDLEYTPQAYCPSCDRDVNAYQWWKNADKKFGKYRTQYLYRCPACTCIVEPYYFAAFNIIDWSIPGISVLDRKKPLADPTLRRVQYGLDKYGDDFLIIKGGYDREVKRITEPLPSQTTHNSHAIVAPYLINTDNAKGKDSVAVRSGLEPARTQTTADCTGVVFPFIVENNGQSKTKLVTDPLPCVTTQTKHGIINPESAAAFLSYYNGGSDMASLLNETCGTVTTSDRLSLVRYTKATLENCTYRTIRPHEVQVAMAFGRDYIILGNGKKKVKQLGNAVTPPLMTWLVAQVVNSLS